MNKIRARYGLGVSVDISPDEFAVLHATIEYTNAKTGSLCELCDSVDERDGQFCPRSCRLNACPTLKRCLAYEKSGKPLPEQEHYFVQRTHRVNSSPVQKAWLVYKPTDGKYPKDFEGEWDFKASRI